MQLSPHFMLREFTKSATADSRGIDNTPTAAHLENLQTLASKLEEVRALLKAPVIVSSGYRNPELNRAVGGSPTSSHSQGLAADFSAPRYGSNYAVANSIARSGIAFDQLIYEVGPSSTWVHLGIGPRMRQEVLTWKNGEYRKGVVR